MRNKIHSLPQAYHPFEAMPGSSVTRDRAFGSVIVHQSNPRSLQALSAITSLTLSRAKVTLSQNSLRLTTLMEGSIDNSLLSELPRHVWKAAILTTNSTPSQSQITTHFILEYRLLDSTTSDGSSTIDLRVLPITPPILAVPLVGPVLAEVV